MQLVMLFVLAISTSLDSLGVGVIYGLGGIRIRLASHVCICAVMMAITWSAVAVGNGISRFLPENVAQIIGAIVFSGIGIWILAPLMRGPKNLPAQDAVDSLDHVLSPLAVLENPKSADMDGSRTIDLREAFLLGVALSINNIFGGISAGIIHISPFGMALLSVLFNVLCLVSGHFIGKHFYASRAGRRAQIVSGVMMIAVGIWQLR